ncbi:hypothetical protein PC123_g13513 [Phytophthora cactorum]|nr:hypothetical protein PC123_g13513 [Phytophthora cactorum]
MATRKLLVISMLLLHRVSSFTYQQKGYWGTTDCSGASFYMGISRNSTADSATLPTIARRTLSTAQNTTAPLFASKTPVTGLKTTDYVMVEQFEPSTDCEGYFEGRVFLANDSCIKMINSTSYQSAIASVYKNDSMSLKMFDDNACSTTAANTLSVHSTTVARHLCFNNMYKFFSENQYTSSSGSFSSLGK